MKYHLHLLHEQTSVLQGKMLHQSECDSLAAWNE